MGFLHIELFLLAICINALQSAAAFETLMGQTGWLLNFCNWHGLPLIERFLWLGVAYHLTRYYHRLETTVEAVGGINIAE